MSRAQPRPAFEVSTIKPNHSDDHRMMIRPAPGGRFNASNVTLKLLMTVAYRIQDDQISGGPGWIDSDRFDIVAKAEGNATSDQVLLMLQTLLEDRFKLKLRRETKDLPMYALVVARNGPTLKASDGDCPAGAQPPKPPAVPCGAFMMSRNQLSGQKVPLGQLTAALSRILARQVVDKTGLTGRYDLKLEWTPDETQARLGPGDPGPGQPPPESSGPSIFTAIQEQLGLRLESQKGPVEMFVIDHAEKPDDN